jgi:hypothetical protein
MAAGWGRSALSLVLYLAFVLWPVALIAVGQFSLGWAVVVAIAVMVGMFIHALRQRIEFPIPAPPPEHPAVSVPRVYSFVLLMSLAVTAVGMATVVTGAIAETRWIAQLGFWIMVGSFLFRLVFAWFWRRRNAASRASPAMEARPSHGH